MKQQNIAAPTLEDFVKQGASEGFQLMADAVTGDIVSISKSGKPQLIFRDKDSDLIFVRISVDLDAALIAGEPVKLEESPVYDIELKDDNGKAMGNMFVVGMKAEGKNLKAADIKTAFKTYKRPEPA